MKRGVSLALVVAALSWAAAARADEPPIPPAPQRWVTDEAGMLSATQREALDRRLEAYEKTTRHQVLVWIGRTLGDAAIEDWSVRTFEAWRVGRRGIDDGLVLFVFARDRKVRIEVGYGLEGVVTDAQASRTIREVIAPRMREGNPDAAIGGAVDRLLALIGGERGAPPREVAPEPRRDRSGGWAQMIGGAVLALIFIILFITNPRLAMLMLVSMAGGRRDGWGGGGFGGGGGFSGGGGRSGGGGASGSW